MSVERLFANLVCLFAVALAIFIVYAAFGAYWTSPVPGPSGSFQ